jgi:xanthine dehydrogenase accessory factor
MEIPTTRLLPIDRGGRGQLSLGQPPQGVAIDPWTAIVLLFHDHEWEAALLRWALATPALLIGAQGGAQARADRDAMLERIGCTTEDKARIHSPIGLIPRTRDPQVLALSVLAECVASYERLLAG